MIRKLSDAHLLAGASLIIPGIGMTAPLGLAPLLVVVAVGLLAMDPRSRSRSVRPLLPLVILLSLMAVWGAISASWSVIPKHSLLEAARLAALSGLGILTTAAAVSLDERGRKMVGRASVLGLLVALAIVLVELVGKLPIHRILYPADGDAPPLAVLDRGAVVLALSCWVPVSYLMARRRFTAAGVLIAATLLAVLLLASLGARLGLVVALGVFPMALWRPRVAAALLVAIFSMLALALPLAPPSRSAVLWLHAEAPGLRDSAFHRLVIWRFASDRIAERPALGWGMDGSRAMPGGNTKISDYLDLPPDFFSVPLEGGEVMPLHPHNAILQWWLELGLPGALLGSAIFLWTALRAGAWRARSRAGPAAALSIMTAAASPLLLDFGIWQSWWQSTMWLLAALVIAAGNGMTPLPTYIEGSAQLRAGRSFTSDR